MSYPSSTTTTVPLRIAFLGLWIVFIFGSCLEAVADIPNYQEMNVFYGPAFLISIGGTGYFAFFARRSRKSFLWGFGYFTMLVITAGMGHLLVL